MLFRPFLRLAAVLILIGFGSTAALAYDKIVVFGDSYNDVGNIYLATTQLGFPYPPAPYYYQGRFSNGPIWLDHIASDLGIPLAPSLAGGTDYAVGGAELLKHTTIDGYTIPSIEEQLAVYLAANNYKADPNALYVIEGGGNDILDATEFNSGKLGCAIATALYDMERALRNAGAKHFLIPDLLDVGQIPAAAAGGDAFIKFASNTTIVVNQELAGKLAAESHLPGIEIVTVPVFKTFLAVANASTHFGFTNVTTPCLVTNGLEVISECADPDHTLWFDAEHPSEFGHAFFAVLVEGALANH
jgi:outer membrane lipase/esterase